jgi:hypothetical protein
LISQVGIFRAARVVEVISEVAVVEMENRVATKVVLVDENAAAEGLIGCAVEPERAVVNVVISKRSGDVPVCDHQTGIVFATVKDTIRD